MKLNKMLIAAFTVAALWSCQKEDVDTEFTIPEESAKELITRNFNGQDLEFEVLDDDQLRLGDMVVDLNQTYPVGLKGPLPEDPPVVETAGQKLAIANIRKWTNNTIIYQIASNVNSRLREMTMNSMREWSSKTNIRFKERTNETNFVDIGLSGKGCNCAFASLGMSSRGVIRMGDRTTEDVMVHEFGHTLGFIHEQNRADRDQYINVNFDNIDSDGRDQYFISRSATPLTNELDINSTMMYSSRTFGNGRGPTMTIKATGRPVPGGGRTLTALDIAGTNNAYPGATTNPDPDPTPAPTGDICEGVSPWQRISYPIGAKITYRGFLFQRVFGGNGWNNLGRCGAPTPKDLCDGVAVYNPRVRYSNGDKVVYQGDLYQAINYRWILQDKCGS